MEAFGYDLTNLTLVVVKRIEQRFRQSEKTATVEVGVAIGALASIVILLGILCSTRVCLTNQPSGVGGRACCAKVPRDLNMEGAQDDDDDVAGNERSEHEQSPARTEGAYRSESDTDDEGEGVRVAREAQKRARASGEV